jgi:outer membrane protein
MKKHVFAACLAATISLVAGAANADSINGRFGVTAKLGFLVPADNRSDFYHNSTDTGIVGGGGLIYGLDDHFALDLDVTRTGFGSETGDFGVTDVSLGGQYRFTSIRSQLVPYIGVGIDVLAADYRPYDGSSRDVDTKIGGHISGGLDYFIRRQFALNAELRGTLAADAAITNRFGDRVGNFDPSSFSSTFGIRYFFN